MNILLVDSQKLFSEGLRNILLTSEGVSSVHISNDNGFINDTKYHDIDMVICDMNVPKQGGFKIIDQIRNTFKKENPYHHPLGDYRYSVDQAGHTAWRQRVYFERHECG